MTNFETRITDSFTTGHANQTLESIIENVNREINDPESTLDKRELQRVERYLQNAISQIKEAQEVIYRN